MTGSQPSILEIPADKLQKGIRLTDLDTHEKDEILVMQQLALQSEKEKRIRDLIILTGFFFMILITFYYLSKKLAIVHKTKLEASQPKVISIRKYQYSKLEFIEPVQKPKVVFTAREKEVITLVERGKTNQEIAKELYVSENTVKTHLKNIFSKTEARNRTDLLHKIKS